MEEEIGKEFPITVYLLKDEWDTIEAKAQNMGVSLEDYIKSELEMAGSIVRGQLHIITDLQSIEKDNEKFCSNRF